jgi:pilus assembly protein Flp/PilA
MLKKIKNLVVQEKGQALTEYGLIIGLVAIACITAMVTLGSEISGVLGKIGNGLKKVVVPS